MAYSGYPSGYSSYPSVQAVQLPLTEESLQRRGHDAPPAGRHRFLSVESIFDPNDSDPALSTYRGLAFLALDGLCVICFGIGLLCSLIRVEAMGGTSMAMLKLCSLLDIIRMKWENEEYSASICTFCFCVILPTLMFFGTMIVIFDNFFAKGFGYPSCFSARTRNMIVSAMCMGVSYQTILFYMPALFVCFFTTGITAVEVAVGYWAYLIYCVMSIGSLQFIEILKEPVDDDLDVGSPSQTVGMATEALRSRIASWVPDLPGMERIVRVDTLQVTFYMLLGCFCYCVGKWQPLLELHISYLGLTFEDKRLTLDDVLQMLSPNLPLYLVFQASVFWIPFAYGMLLLLTGLIHSIEHVIDHNCHKQMFAVSMWTASLLRPWAMTDVFAVSLAIFLWSCQAHYMQTTIPDGFMSFPSDDGPKVMKIHYLSGMYMVLGAGTAVFYLRWFWQAPAPQPLTGYTPGTATTTELDPMSSYGDQGQLTSSFGEQQGFPRVQTPREPSPSWWPPPIVRCVCAWILLCVAVNYMPFPMAKFRLEKTNTVLNKTLPYIHAFIVEELPVSYGSCTGTPDVPQPCTEGGILYQDMQDTKRISVMYVSGLNSLRVTTLAIHEKEDEITTTTTTSGDSVIRMEPDWLKTRHLASSHSTSPTSVGLAAPQDEGALVPANVTRKKLYKISVGGQLKELSIFLRIEMCDDKQGHGCKLFLDTNSSCCQPHRHFLLEISMECRQHRDELPKMAVSSFALESLLVNAHKDMLMSETNVRISLPIQNITDQVRNTIKSQIVDYLTKKKVLKWGDHEMNFQELMGRVLRFSVEDDIFQC